MSKKNSHSSADPNDALAGRLVYALNHPLRRRILEALIKGPASATTLSELFEIKLANVSYHLGEVLGKQCEVAAVVEEHQRRGATEKVYALRREAYIGAIQWPAIPEPLRSGVLGLTLASFQRVAIAALEAEEDVKSMPNADLYGWRSVEIDDAGQREIRVALEELAGKVEAIEDRCATLDPGKLMPTIVAAAAFRSGPLSAARIQRDGAKHLRCSELY